MSKDDITDSRVPDTVDSNSVLPRTGKEVPTTYLMEHFYIYLHIEFFMEYFYIYINI